MTLRRLVAVFFGLGFVVAGSMVWRSRLDSSPELNLRSHLGDRLTEVSSRGSTDLSRACDVFNDSESWILFVLEANQLMDSTQRTYFETDDLERTSLWVELEPPLLRLGMGLGLENPESSTQLPIHVVRRTERFTAMIAVTRLGSELIVNGQRLRSDWPNIPGTRWACRNVRIGGDIGSLSEGYSCDRCDVTLRYASGENYSELGGILDSLSNVSRFNSRRWVGNLLVLGGLLVIVASVSVQNRKRVVSRVSHNVLTTQAALERSDELK